MKDFAQRKVLFLVVKNDDKEKLKPDKIIRRTKVTKFFERDENFV